MLTSLVAIIAGPFLVGLAALLVARRSVEWAGRLALLAPATVAALGVPLWREVAGGATRIVPVEFLPALGITANLRVDRLGVFFVLLIGIIGIGIVQYARFYLKEKATGGFWGLLLAFMGSMLGIVLADSLILLFLFWEMTTITSALLIGMDFEEAESRRGAIQAFLVTGLGGLALLGGIALLGQLAGSYDLSVIAERSETILADPRYVAPFLLMLLGAFTKSAQFPFSFWLPGAMAAPAPISAYLHSATMVKAGVFLLGRMFPIFGDAPLWFPILVAVGLTTFLVAGWNAIRAFDLKQLLAWSTVAYLGVLTALYGYYAYAGLQGELLNILNHALYKSSLFLLVGWVEKTMGTRDLAVLESERWIRREPAGAALIGVGALAMAGVPFLLGFMSKEVFVYAVLGDTPGRLVFLAITVAASALAFGYAAKLFVGTFFGSSEPPTDRGYPRKKISPWLLIVPAILLVPQVVGGVIPGWFLGGVLEPGVEWPTGAAFWHYADAALAVSLSAFTAGALLFLGWRRIARLPSLPGAIAVSDALAQGALDLGAWFTRAVQKGGHPRFVAVTLLASLAAVAVVLWPRLDEIALPTLIGPDIGLAWLPTVAIVGAAVLTLLVPKRIPKVVMMAVIGYGMAVFYVIYRAPDLALTQLLVETVSLILLLLIFRRMPELGVDPRPGVQKLQHGLVALTVGLAMGALAWSAGAYDAVNRAGTHQLAMSYPEAKGRNVVNVILVDFRGVDTFGEIAVLAIAALGAAALLLRTREEPEQVPEPIEPPVVAQVPEEVLR
jgi:multicomponent K+:H+ antiporter subunit A